jgi:hypothetical protein
MEPYQEKLLNLINLMCQLHGMHNKYIEAGDLKEYLQAFISSLQDAYTLLYRGKPLSKTEEGSVDAMIGSCLQGLKEYKEAEIEEQKELERDAKHIANIVLEKIKHPERAIN